MAGHGAGRIGVRGWSDSGGMTMRDQRSERDLGIERAETGAGEGWRRLARIALKICACRSEYLSADDVWPVLAEHGIEPREPRAMGPIMLYGRKSAWLVPTGTMHRTTTPHRPNHMRPQERWRSLIFGDTPPDWPEASRPRPRPVFGRPDTGQL